jgi:phosphatidate phosphatase APP1
VKSDKTILFFPTAACRCPAAPGSPAGGWTVPIHGWIYRGSEASRLSRAGLHLARRYVQLRHRAPADALSLFTQRLASFLADNERNQHIRIQIAGQEFALKKSRSNGHIRDSLSIPEIHPDPDGWARFEATHDQSPIKLSGKFLPLPDEGLSVISDIDDTIKISEVLDRRRLLTNTFLNAFASVPGMPDLYQHWQTSRHASFHYVSASPWHLYPCLWEFLSAQGFPAGTFHMRTFRLAGRDLTTAFRSPRRVKSLHIKNLLNCHPHRRFILVGDSGESDPEMYAHFAQNHPAQIDKIYIRNITTEPSESPRWQKTFANLPKQKWQLFTDPHEVMVK